MAGRSSRPRADCRGCGEGSKGVYRKHGGSNAVGFRCVQDIDSHTEGHTDSDSGGMKETTP